MRERKVVIKRRAALVIGNMCKLVNDPRTAALFYPILKPVLERGIDEIAVEEVRKVCQTSLDTLQRVSSEAAELSDKVMDLDQLKECINGALKTEGKCADAAKYSKIVDFIAKACLFLVLADNKSIDEWTTCIVPYVKAIVGDKADAVFALVHEKGTENLSKDKQELEDEEEDLCNAQFSLAYGTRVLLHQTPFRVKIGRKYGLVGPNGAGKSTLMKSIAGGNLAGFPTELVTVYVECEIIGEKAQQMGMKEAEVSIRGVGAGRESALRAFAGKGIGITRITDRTPVPFNGPRAPKARRVQLAYENWTKIQNS